MSDEHFHLVWEEDEGAWAMSDEKTAVKLTLEEAKKLLEVAESVADHPETYRAVMGYLRQAIAIDLAKAETPEDAMKVWQLAREVLQ